jgi:hypothetical protein
MPIILGGLVLLCCERPRGKQVSFDLLVTAVMIVLVFSGMRLLYGAWPWEADKTWYHTRQAVEYVVALQRAHRERALRVVGTSETSNDSFARNLPPPRLVGCDASCDSFDRSLMAHDNSPPEVVTPPMVPPPAEQLTPLHSIASEADRPSTFPVAIRRAR